MPAGCAGGGEGLEPLLWRKFDAHQRWLGVRALSGEECVDRCWVHGREIYGVGVDVHEQHFFLRLRDAINCDLDWPIAVGSPESLAHLPCLQAAHFVTRGKREVRSLEYFIDLRLLRVDGEIIPQLESWERLQSFPSLFGLH